MYKTIKLNPHDYLNLLAILKYGSEKSKNKFVYARSYNLLKLIENQQKKDNK